MTDDMFSADDLVDDFVDDMTFGDEKNKIDDVTLSGETNKIGDYDDLTMYIVINNSLGMQKGKVASQVAQGVIQVVENILMQKISYDIKKNMSDILAPNTNKDIVPIDFTRYEKWKENGTKTVAIKTSQNDIEKLAGYSKAFPFYDEGLTQVAPGSLTVVIFMPTNEYNKEFEKYLLL